MGGNGNVLYLDCVDFMVMWIHQNSSNWTVIMDFKNTENNKMLK